MSSQPQKKKAAQTSQKSSTEENAPSETAALLALMQEMKEFISPIVAYRKQGETAGSCDVRIRWDVEIVIGSETCLLHTSGISTLPELVSTSQVHLATTRLDTELVTKIVIPAVSKMQALANQKGLDFVKDVDLPPSLPVPEDMFCGLPGTEVDVALEAELISQASPVA